MVFTIKELGKKGEERVIEFLKKQKYDILEKNFLYFGKSEIDIIAAKEHFLVFVEVKTRLKEDHLTSLLIPLSKQKKIIEAAKYYLYVKGLSSADFCIRFDVALVLPTFIRYIENAYQYTE